ncbi:hypothetical protein [Lacinutrix undariae]
MKNTLLFTLLLILLFSCNNDSSEKLHTLVIKKDYCDIEHEGMIFLPEFELRKNDLLLSSHKTEMLNDYYTIDSLKSGDYNIVYTSMFKRVESLNIVLNNKDIDTLIVCLDKINYSSIDYIPFVDKLRDNENFEINVFNQGCVSLGSGTIKINKTQDKIIAETNNKKKELTSEEIEYLRHFEIELINMNSCCCTSTDFYTLKYNDEVLEIKDGSCNWYGYGRLYNLIFDVES